MSATETDPAQIERELGETRSRLGGHLDALQNRLSPGQLLDDVMAQLRSNGGAEFGRNLLDSVRANPLPAALTGVGLAWMMASNGRNTGTVANALPDPIRSDINARLRKAELGVRRAADEPEHAYDARLASARGQVLGVARHAQETTSSFSARVADAMAAARESVSDSVHDERERLGNAGEALRGAAGSISTSISGAGQSLQGAAGSSWAQGRDQVARIMEAIAESPVLLGALGVAAGAVLGALLPVSEQERVHLGGVAGQVRDSAAGVARDLADQGSAVARAAMDGGRSAAEARGLTESRSVGGIVDAALSGELASGAAEVAHAALRAGDEAARDRLQPRGANGAN
jgi:DNA-binding FrmR family transcriptional regulator